LLHDFLDTHRDELARRCRAKVALRRDPRATDDAMEHGIPLFLGQLIATLQGEVREDASRVGTREGSTMMAEGAAKHGHELLERGYTIDQVVHDYGDLCQAATELAIETRAAISVSEFQTLNRCLDEAIAGAVHEFGAQRDASTSRATGSETRERLGHLAHELRNHVNTAVLAFTAIKLGGVAPGGATSAVLERSLIGLGKLIDRTIADARLSSPAAVRRTRLDVGAFLLHVRVGALLIAQNHGCEFNVLPVAAGTMIEVDEDLLHSAVSNLLENAFKYTRPHTRVTLSATRSDGRVRISVEDHCGGVPANVVRSLLVPFKRGHDDATGLRPGLSITREAVDAIGGELRVHDNLGAGCVFTVDLPSAP
jgi:signal transduction histidine kinase